MKKQDVRRRIRDYLRGLVGSWLALAFSIATMVVIYYLADWLFQLPALFSLIIAFLGTMFVERIISVVRGT